LLVLAQHYLFAQRFEGSRARVYVFVLERIAMDGAHPFCIASIIPGRKEAEL
jgi:hypothetical protein